MEINSLAPRLLVGQIQQTGHQGMARLELARKSQAVGHAARVIIFDDQGKRSLSVGALGLQEVGNMVFWWGSER